MQEAKKMANRILAEKMIEKLKLRRMEGFYVETKEEALALVKEKFLTQGKSVCYGGSVTLQETGIMDWLKESPCDVIDRTAFSTPEEEKEIKARMINSDYFLMSTNAITTDGELIVIAGMNKVVTDVESGLKRVRLTACPPNAVRLNKKTPCAVNGMCGNCYGEDCICSQFVVTRRSGVKNRIKVILVGEELGY